MASAFLGAIAAAFGLLACLNSRTPNHHAFREGVSARAALNAPEPLQPWPERARVLESQLAQSRDQRTLNDLAVALLHLGETKRAIPLLEEIEQRFPGEYRTAANLGTAYELDGRLEDALRWIEEGLKRNPQSHDGTEWLHVRILQAKLALRVDPAWLETHRVSGLVRTPEGSFRFPAGHDGQPLSDEKKWRGLQVQLRERRPFTPEKDELVAQLLEDFADLTALRSGLPVAAAGLLELAASYSEKHAAELGARARAAARSHVHAQRHPWPAVLLLGLPVVSGVLAVAGRILSRRTPPPQPPWVRVLGLVARVSLPIFIISIVVLVLSTLAVG